MTSSRQHWNSIFSTRDEAELGWYEKDVSQTLKFLDLIPQHETATVFLAGAGATSLAEILLSGGARLIVNDISDAALDRLKRRIPADEDRVTWLHHDVSRPFAAGAPGIDIWIDRAVLHFLLDEADIQGYFRNAQAMIRPGGYALLAEFSTAGAPRCAGLELHRYSVEEMTERMGTAFELVRHEDYTFLNPDGDPRPYLYALYRKRHRP